MAGGAGWAGAPAALLRSVRRLREVFEVCGRDPDGFLRVERVAALGLRFGQGEEVRARGRRACARSPSPASRPFHLSAPSPRWRPHPGRDPSRAEDPEPWCTLALSDPRLPP